MIAIRKERKTSGASSCQCGTVPMGRGSCLILVIKILHILTDVLVNYYDEQTVMSDFSWEIFINQGFKQADKHNPITWEMDPVNAFLILKFRSRKQK